VINETLPALQKLKEQGLVRFIGFTGLPLKVYRRILDRRARASALCDTGAPSGGLQLFRYAPCMHTIPDLLVCVICPRAPSCCHML
jgi:hypothetical protein